MTAKQLGAWLVVVGIFSILLSFAGLHFKYLWFLDEMGSVAGYAMKGGLIALGVWLFRRGDNVSLDEDFEPATGRKAWVPVAIGGVVVLGALGFMVFGFVRDARAERAINRLPTPAAWAKTPVTNWPALVMLQDARFEHHSPMQAGCASLVRLPTGEIAALTAGHLLGAAGGVKPGFLGSLGSLDQAKLKLLDREIRSWKLFVPAREDQAVGVAGLFGEPGQFDEDCDQLLLRVASQPSGCPVTPLGLRLTPVPMGEELRVVRCEQDEQGGFRQVVHVARRIPGLGFTCELDEPADLNGCSGAPVIDRDGLVVAIVTGGTLKDAMSSAPQMHGFSGHLITELKPVLKGAVGRRPESAGTLAQR